MKFSLLSFGTFFGESLIYEMDFHRQVLARLFGPTRLLFQHFQRILQGIRMQLIYCSVEGGKSFAIKLCKHRSFFIVRWETGWLTRVSFLIALKVGRFITFSEAANGVMLFMC